MPVVDADGEQQPRSRRHLTFTCTDSVMAGMEGYAIIKANFQHARGMGFVVANTRRRRGLDVAHGYMAEVIDNPPTATRTAVSPLE